MDRLTGKVAIVTGAGRGIGRAVARRFAAEGASVAVLSYTTANVERTVAEIVEAGGTALGLSCDVGDAAQIEDCVARVVERFGAIDILVNNAFEFSSALSTVMELDVAKLQRQFDTGPIACLRFMQACHPHLQGRDGRVINFASSVGLQGTAGFAPYAMAKEAIRALTRVAAREWGASRITVNSILPLAATDAYEASMASDGVAAMPTLPIPRMGSPEDDIAPIALFLASADSGYMTGCSFTADGGFMIDAAR